MAFPPEHALGGPLHVVRLYDPRYEPLDATGARRHGGRWNSPGHEVVYAAMTYAGAILETRAHANVPTPPPREIAGITIPSGTKVSEILAADLPHWDDADQVVSRAAGDAWLAAGRTVALIVPSRAGAPLEKIAVLNLMHVDARHLKVKSLGPVPWDLRLFSAPEPRAIRRSRSPRRKK